MGVTRVSDKRLVLLLGQHVGRRVGDAWLCDYIMNSAEELWSYKLSILLICLGKWTFGVFNTR